MRNFRPPPPTAEELRSRRVHELVRDYPELLTPLESLGVDPGSSGARSLGEILPQDERWVKPLLEAVAWRREGGPEESPG